MSWESEVYINQNHENYHEIAEFSPFCKMRFEGAFQGAKAFKGDLRDWKLEFEEFSKFAFF